MADTISPRQHQYALITNEQTKERTNEQTNRRHRHHRVKPPLVAGA